jgi:hypothetical protein
LIAASRQRRSADRFRSLSLTYQLHGLGQTGCLDNITRNLLNAAARGQYINQVAAAFPVTVAMQCRQYLSPIGRIQWNDAVNTVLTVCLDTVNLRFGQAKVWQKRRSESGIDNTVRRRLGESSDIRVTSKLLEAQQPVRSPYDKSISLGLDTRTAGSGGLSRYNHSSDWQEE